MKTAALSIVLVCFATPSLADLKARFDEGAPKDRFTITNTGCSLGATTLTIDLAGSPYGLIFDVTGSGAGVEVFQPFELTTGSELLSTRPQVADGDNRLTLDVADWPAGATISFTIDVDDTQNNREITVSNQEIVGAEVMATSTTGSARASFEEDTTATVKLSGCTS